MSNTKYLDTVIKFLSNSNFEKAINYLEEFIAKFPKDFGAKFVLALLYETTEFYLDGYKRGFELLSEIPVNNRCYLNCIILKASMEEKYFAKVSIDSRLKLQAALENENISERERGEIFLLIARSYDANSIEYREYLKESIKYDISGVRNYLFLSKALGELKDRDSLVQMAKSNVKILDEEKYFLEPLNFERYKNQFVRGVEISPAVYQLYFEQ